MSFRSVSSALLAVMICSQIAFADEPSGDYHSLDLPSVEKAMKAEENFYGKGHVKLYPRMLQMARCYEAQGNFDAALLVYRDVMRVQDNYRIHDKRVTWDGLHGVVRLLERKGNKQAAESLRRHELAIEQPSVTSEKSMLISDEEMNRDGQIRSLFQQPRSSANAEELRYKKILELCSSSKSSRYKDSAISAHVGLAKCFDSQGRFDEARKELLKGLSLDKNNCETLQSLCELEEKQQRYGLAMQYNERLLDLWSKSMGDASDSSVAVLERLIDLSGKTSKEEERNVFLSRLIAVQSMREGANSAIAKDLKAQLVSPRSKAPM